MLWWVALLVAIVGSRAAQTHMVLDYEHLKPETLPWEEGAAEHRLDPKVAEVRLAMTVVETARALKALAAKPESPFVDQTTALEAKVKGEVYRKVLQQSLAHSRRDFKRLSSASIKGPNDAILRQWLLYLSGPDLVHRILYSLQNPSCENDLEKKRPNPNYQKDISEATTEKPVGEVKDVTGEEVRRPSGRGSEVGKKKVNQDLISLLMGTVLQQVSVLSNNSTNKRHRRNDQGLMYLPVGGTTKVQCPTAADAAGVSITQMAFLSISLTVFNIIVNINNNINNNNNNNNINSDNNLSNNNAQLSLNVNNAGQVNVMLPPPIPGRKRRAALREVWQQESRDSTLNLTLWAQNLETEHALNYILQEQGMGINSERPITVKSAENTTVITPDHALLGPEAHRENQTALTEPSVGNAFDDFSLPTPLPGVLSIQSNYSNAKKPSYKAEGIATGILQAIKTWVSDSPLLSLECRGLLWCSELKEAPDRHKWLLLLASYSSHQRTQGRHSLSLTRFVESALAQDTCQHLFPTCRNAAAL